MPLVLAHEWNDPALIRRLGERRAHSDRFRLLFHDTHHRAVTAPAEMAAFDLRHYDGVLADVAPRLLQFAGLPRWPGMTGQTLIDAEVAAERPVGSA